MPPRKPRSNKRPKETVGLDAREVAEASKPSELAELGAAIEADGGAALATYRDPLGGKWVMLASLPIDKVEPTPYQRELSDTHVKRLVGVIPKVGQFLDPVIAVRHDGAWWTPNGM